MNCDKTSSAESMEEAMIAMEPDLPASSVYMSIRVRVRECVSEFVSLDIELTILPRSF